MAVTATQVGLDDVLGKRKMRVFDLVFSGTYPDEGEPYTAAMFGFANAVESVIVHGGVLQAADVETAVPVSVDYATQKFTCYEDNAVAAAAALTEKTAAEAYPVGAKCRVTVTGY